MEDEPINLIGCDTIVNSPSKQYLMKLIIIDYLVLTWFIYHGFLDPDPQNILLGLIRFFILISFGFPEPGFLGGFLLQLLLFITVRIQNFLDLEFLDLRGILITVGIRAGELELEVLLPRGRNERCQQVRLFSSYLLHHHW